MDKSTFYTSKFFQSLIINIIESYKFLELVIICNKALYQIRINEIDRISIQYVITRIVLISQVQDRFRSCWNR